MYICYGISNGPYYNGPRDIGEESQFLWRPDVDCGITVQEKDDLVLTFPDFDPIQSTAVAITLKRKADDALMVKLMANSLLLNGKPELVWGEWRD